MISVVIPLYNKASSIERAVDSVLAQTITDWELVVVDDGSVDEGPALVASYNDPRIRLFKQANSGVAAARNKGSEMAANETLAFLDADDYWEPTHLDNLKLLIDQFPEAALFGTAYYVVGGDGLSRKIRVRSADIPPKRLLMADYFADVVEMTPPLNSSSVAIKKSWFKAIGGFPIGLESGEDAITWARLACTGDIAYSKIATSYYVLPPVSFEKRKYFLRRPPSTDYVGKELLKLLETSAKFKPSLTCYLADWYRIRGMLYLELNERRASFSELWKAIHLDKLTVKDVVCCALLILPPVVRSYALSQIRRMRGRV